MSLPSHSGLYCRNHVYHVNIVGLSVNDKTHEAGTTARLEELRSSTSSLDDLALLAELRLLYHLNMDSIIYASVFLRNSSMSECYFSGYNEYRMWVSVRVGKGGGGGGGE